MEKANRSPSRTATLLKTCYCSRSVQSSDGPRTTSVPAARYKPGEPWRPAPFSAVARPCRRPRLPPLPASPRPSPLTHHSVPTSRGLHMRKRGSTFSSAWPAPCTPLEQCSIGGWWVGGWAGEGWGDGVGWVGGWRPRVPLRSAPPFAPPFPHPPTRGQASRPPASKDVEARKVQRPLPTPHPPPPKKRRPFPGTTSSPKTT
jgi:hypothetical protein